MADSLLDLGTESTILSLTPNWISTPGHGFDTGREVLRNHLAYASMRSMTTYNGRRFKAEYFLKDKAEEKYLLDFFYGRMGRLKRFWLPVSFNEFQLAEDIGINDQYFQKVPSNFSLVAQFYERIYIVLKDGSVITRKLVYKDKEWLPVEVDHDFKYVKVNRNTGQYQLAAGYYHVYRSSDYGGSWSIVDDLPAKGWWTCTMSYDGKYQYICEGRDLSVGQTGGGYIWRSIDYGIHWTKLDTGALATTQHWTSMHTSETGEFVYAAIGNVWSEYFAYSHNYGVDWTVIQVDPGHGKDFACVRTTPNGEHVYLTCNDRQIYKSMNYGVTWTVWQANYRRWNCIAFSDNEKYITITTHHPEETGNGRIYRSEDYGATFSQLEVGKEWNGIAMSSDGKYQRALLNGYDPVVSHLYYSDDYGANWHLDEASPEIAWWQVSMTGDGLSIITGVGDDSGYGIFSYTTSDIIFKVLTPFDRDIAVEDIALFGLLLLARFDQDDLSLSYVSDDLSDVSIQFLELPNEYAEIEVES